MPLVSVVMPVFNGEKYVAESINSILTQTLKDIELIIINDGSIDKSGEVIKSIHDDKIIYHEFDKNMGIAAATNLGYNLAQSKYIAHIDQDDIALPHRLKRQVSFLERLAHVDILGGNMEGFGAQSYVSYIPIADGEIKANLLFGAANIYNPTAMIRNSFLKEKQLECNTTFKVPDWEFWVQAMFQGARFANLNEIILRYRAHENQESKNLNYFLNEFIPVRLSVIELFYPELTPEERIAVEPFLQWLNPPALSCAQVEAALGVINKLLTYKKQSRVKENRQTLQLSLEKRKKAIQEALQLHRSALTG
jgi:glycosyltransferase involved in cell wall biosynthesis